ncbi:DUF2933 domain-containing protein [Streptomyces sp. NPDC051740]|uniref:DUF2933 domain-containing protein n=1 Tax=Streptomyces sp. NPDC051740 TaxID=3365673 RepID=UPI00379B9F08
MRNQRNYGMYALAAAIVVVGALIVGASLESLIWLVLVAACPPMMFFMVKGMHGGHSRDERDDDLLHKRHQ